MASSPPADISGRITCGHHLFPAYANLINGYTETCVCMRAIYACAHMRIRARMQAMAYLLVLTIVIAAGLLKSQFLTIFCNFISSI